MATVVIQNRRGSYGAFDPSRLAPGEFAVVQSNDTTTDTGMALYICISSGNILRIVTSEELLGYESSLESLTQQVEDALDSIASALAKIEELEDVEERITEAVDDYLNEHPELIASIPDGSITTLKLDDSAVTDTKIANGAVTTAKLDDEAVAGGKIADGAVNTAKLSDNSVTTPKLADNAVTTPKIANTAVTAAKLNSDITTFTQAANRANIISAETFPTILGKIAKFFADIESGIVDSIANKVAKAGDIMSGDLSVEKADDTSRLKVLTTSNGTPVAGGQMSCNATGDFGLYDNVNAKWVIQSDSAGTTRIPLNVVMLNSTAVRCTQVGTSYEYTSLPALANWNVVGIRFTVHQNVHTIYAVRGISYDIGFTDTPTNGYFRGTLLVDWANNRIGMRCINAGTGNTYYNLVYFDYIFGIM